LRCEKPLGVDGPECKTVAVLRADFSKIPKRELEVITTAKGRHYHLEDQIEMRSGARITFRLIYKGARISILLPVTD
jgi:hypothetical protein